MCMSGDAPLTTDHRVHSPQPTAHRPAPFDPAFKPLQRLMQILIRGAVVQKQEDAALDVSQDAPEVVVDQVVGLEPGLCVPQLGVQGLRHGFEVLAFRKELLSLCDAVQHVQPEAHKEGGHGDEVHVGKRRSGGGEESDDAPQRDHDVRKQEAAGVHKGIQQQTLHQDLHEAPQPLGCGGWVARIEPNAVDNCDERQHFADRSHSDDSACHLGHVWGRCAPVPQQHQRRHEEHAQGRGG